MKRTLLAIGWMLLCAVAPAQEAPWIAKWIQAPWSTVRDGAEADGSRPMPIFRREFTVRGKVTKAELRIAGLGQFEARIGSETGSQLVGQPGLHQAWTDYKKTVTYEGYDVTRSMEAGPHAIGVMLGNGMYNVQRSVMANGKPRYTKFEGSFGAPKLIAELRLTYVDGHTEVIATDDKWKASRGPVLFSSMGSRRLPGRCVGCRADSGWAGGQADCGPCAGGGTGRDVSHDQDNRGRP
jgi:hypothetical protein